MFVRFRTHRQAFRRVVSWISWKAATMPAKPTALGSESRPGGGPSAEDDIFGLWLRRQLHQCYAAIIAEPIPEELLRLIEERVIRPRRGA
jgi:hypothetical protein